MAVAARGTETSGGVFDLAWRLAGSPGVAANDAFAEAVVLAGERGRITGISLSATVEPGEPLGTGVSTAWWRWEAPTSGTFTWRSESYGRESTLAVFTGERLREIELVAVGSEVRFVAEKGVTYSIAVGRLQDSAFRGTNYHPELSWGVTPRNDDLSTPIVVSGSRGSITASHDFATTSQDEHEFVAGHSSLWWRWTAPESGWYRFELEQDDALGIFGQGLLAIYGAGTGARKLIATTDRSYLLNGYTETYILAKAGVGYLVQIALRPYSSSRSSKVHWHATDPPMWLLYGGRTVDGDALPNGGSLVLAEPRGLAVDPEGPRLFVNDRDALSVFDVDLESGDLALDSRIPHGDFPRGSSLDRVSLRWNATHSVLHVTDAFGRTHALQWPEGNRHTIAECVMEYPADTVSTLHFARPVDGFLYTVSYRAISVYRVDAPCEFTLVQSLSALAVDHAAAEQVAEVQQIYDAQIDAGGDRFFAARDDALLVFSRDADTGKLRLGTVLVDGGTDSDGLAVELPRGLRSLAIDGSGRFLFVVGNRAPQVAVFNLIPGRDEPRFVGAVDKFPFDFASGFLTHLAKPKASGRCENAVGGVEAVAYVMCDDVVYAVQWSEEAAEVSVSDYFDHLTPDRFGNEIHPFGSPLEAVHTGDGSRIYFSAPEWPYAVVNVGTTASRPVPQSSRTRFGVHLEDGVTEVNVGILFPDFFVAPSGTTPRYEVSASHPGFAVRLEDGILSLARSDDSAESVTVTVTASWGGYASSLTLHVAVEPEPRGFQRGWRLALPTAARGNDQDSPGAASR